jgi:hypothetical protein
MCLIAKSVGTVVEWIYCCVIYDIFGFNRPEAYCESLDTSSRHQCLRLLLNNYLDEELVPMNIWRFNLLLPYGIRGRDVLDWNQYKARTEKRLDDYFAAITQVYQTEIDFDTQDGSGETCVTALAYLSTHIDWDGYLDLFAGLLKGGLNVNSRTSSNRNPFHMALYGCVLGTTTEEWSRKAKNTTISNVFHS